MPLPAEYRRHSFLLLGAVLFVGGITLLVVLYTWYMLEPQLAALLWAVCATLVLRSLKRGVARALLDLGRSVPYRAKWMALLALWSAYTLLVNWGHDALWPSAALGERVVLVSIAVSLAALVLLPWVVSTDTLATLAVITTVLAVGAAGSAFVLKTTYEETAIVAAMLRRLVDEYIAQAKAVAADVDNVDDVWQRAGAACTSLLPVEVPYLSVQPQQACLHRLDEAREQLPDYIASMASMLTSNVQWFGERLIGSVRGVLDLVGSVSDAFFALFVFISTLYYCLKNERALAREMRQLSPLDREENQLILSSLYDKVIKTFYLSGLLATFRFAVALACFYYAEFAVLWVFAFASAFLAIVPILSSWLIWLPASIVLVARDGFWSTSWAVMVGAHVLAYFFDYVLYKLVGIDKQKPEIIGMAFIMGVYAFGAYGVLIGPLVSGALLALIDIYKAYLPDDEPRETDSERDSAEARELAVASQLEGNGLGTEADRFARALVKQASLYLSPAPAHSKRPAPEADASEDSSGDEPTSVSSQRRRRTLANSLAPDVVRQLWLETPPPAQAHVDTSTRHETHSRAGEEEGSHTVRRSRADSDSAPALRRVARRAVNSGNSSHSHSHSQGAAPSGSKCGASGSESDDEVATPVLRLQTPPQS